jgi:hypothetical protein
MLRNLCSVCQERRPGKLATIYWAWTWPTGNRLAYKQHYDPGCISIWNKAIMIGRKPQPHCSECDEEFVNGISRVSVWATIYLPKQERIDDMIEFHPDCFEAVVDRLTAHATILPNGGSGSGTGAPSPEPEPWPDWADLDLRPQE